MSVWRTQQCSVRRSNGIKSEYLVLRIQNVNLYQPHLASYNSKHAPTRLITQKTIPFAFNPTPAFMVVIPVALAPAEVPVVTVNVVPPDGPREVVEAEPEPVVPSV